MRSLLAAIAVLLPAATAAAAPPWSPPVALGDPTRQAESPRLVVSGDGTALALWADDAGLAYSSRFPGRPEFGSVTRLRSDTLWGAAVYRSTGAALLLGSRFGVNGERVSVSLGTTRGAFGALRAIASGEGVRRPVLAGNVHGDLAVAWFEDRGTANDRVFVRVRRRGGDFGPPIRVAQDVVRSVAVDVGPRGDVIVAWDARGRVRVRIWADNRRAFGRTDTIRSEDAYFSALRPAVLDNGRAIVAWSAQFLSEGGDRGPKFSQVAVRRSGASRFAPAQLLERDPRGSIDEGNLELAATADRPPLVAWTGHDGERAVVRVSEAGRDGVFGPPATVSALDRDGFLADAALSPAGDAVILWTGGVEDPRSTVLAAYRQAGAPGFGAPEPISAGVDGRGAVAAFDPVRGAVTALFTDLATPRLRRVFASDRERGQQ